nr:hypothetical protein [Mycobacterium sp. E3298]
METSSIEVEEKKTNNDENLSVSNEASLETKNVDDEWIWVEGYKGMDENMICRDFQFEIGKTYTYEGAVRLCYSGFHFCLNLDNVFDYYGLDFKNRYFKVRGLVKKTDADKAASAQKYHKYGYRLNNDDSKLSSKQIEIIEELTYDDLKERISYQYPFVENQNDYDICINTSYEIFARNKFLELMKELGFSEAFSIAMMDNYKIAIKKVKTIRALKEEGLSKDMLVYLTINQFSKD